MKTLIILGFLASLIGAGCKPAATAPVTPPPEADAIKGLRTMADHALSLTPTAFQQLADLRAEQKFQEEGMYPGAPTAEIRERAEKAVNEMLDRLSAGLHQTPQKSFVISEFLRMLKAFESEDTEEREQACSYCERVMEIVGIESSDGALNTWLYGFDPEQ
jgi:hypothetical protein